MSQQPPYGPTDPQQPGQAYQQPYTPYSQAAYPNPYGQYPQPKNNTTRNVLLIVGAVVLLFCGGIVAFFAWIVNEIESGIDPDYPGSRNDPITVAEGETFSIRGFDYDEGWQVTTDPTTGSVEIEGLRATNNRADEDDETVDLVFEFYADNARISTVRCDADGSIAHERTAVLECSLNSAEVAGYDEIEVSDRSFNE